MTLAPPARLTGVILAVLRSVSTPGVPKIGNDEGETPVAAAVPVFETVRVAMTCWPTLAVAVESAQVPTRFGCVRTSMKGRPTAVRVVAIGAMLPALKPLAAAEKPSRPDEVAT